MGRVDELRCVKEIIQKNVRNGNVLEMTKIGSIEFTKGRNHIDYLIQKKNWHTRTRKERKKYSVNSSQFTT